MASFFCSCHFTIRQLLNVYYSSLDHFARDLRNLSPGVSFGLVASGKMLATSRRQTFSPHLVSLQMNSATSPPPLVPPSSSDDPPPSYESILAAPPARAPPRPLSQIETLKTGIRIYEPTKPIRGAYIVIAPLASEQEELETEGARTSKVSLEAMSGDVDVDVFIQEGEGEETIEKGGIQATLESSGEGGKRTASLSVQSQLGAVTLRLVRSFLPPSPLLSFPKVNLPFESSTIDLLRPLTTSPRALGSRHSSLSLTTLPAPFPSLPARGASSSPPLSNLGQSSSGRMPFRVSSYLR